ncbi:MAG: GNAT family N-acetyltransferase [Deltaproteobacteria bacterium]|nr:GNAT family N-acetyltransferase [Nannocystaceae bacterium]
MPLRLRACQALSSVDPAAWDALDHGGSPFLEHGFLRALERSRSIGARSGWDPHYILAEWVGDEVAAVPDAAATADTLVGAVACFVKHHSYGEYIFDFPWARAAARGGVEYYPKLVIAAPVTPASGPRILLQREGTAGPPRELVARALVERVRELADELGCSSIHWLFCTAQEQALLAELEFSPRASFQYHWHDQGYPDFEAFLARLTSRKRKSIRKERARAQAAVDTIEWVGGAELDRDDLAAIDRFYRNTTDNHGGQDYLRPGFFQALVELAPERVAWARARKGDALVAGALYLETDRALYGRYWGCDASIELLHFELAYYVGIERCIGRGMPLFEAGAQGEHKLLRGFEPSPTYSSHWIRHLGLREAVERFLAEERGAIERYLVELAALGPYRAEE